MRIFTTILFCILLGKLDAQILAGPYAPPAGQTNSTAIHKDSASIVSWASNCTIVRGYQDISNTSIGLTTVGTSSSATGYSGSNGVVSLGDGGTATLSFEGLITNGPGADFAVFENSFSDDFLELAFVEVSSDGINFFRFESISTVTTVVQTPGFGITDATEVHNLAGKYRAQYGTPFDLDELNGIIDLDINAVSHVRVIDVIGNVNPTYASSDSQNTIINDPWPTPFPSGGFDLDAVGVINFVPTAIQEELKQASISIFPNPAKNFINFKFEAQSQFNYHLITPNGLELKKGTLENSLDISDLNSGIYFLHISSESEAIVKKIIKN